MKNKITPPTKVIQEGVGQLFLNAARSLSGEGDCKSCDLPETMARPKLPPEIRKKIQLMAEDCGALARKVGRLEALIEAAKAFELSAKTIAILQKKLESAHKAYTKCITSIGR